MTKESCSEPPPSRGITRREFIKLGAVAGLLAGCSSPVQKAASTPVDLPTAAPEPTNTPGPKPTSTPRPTSTTARSSNRPTSTP